MKQTKEKLREVTKINIAARNVISSIHQNRLLKIHTFHFTKQWAYRASSRIKPAVVLMAWQG